MKILIIGNIGSGKTTLGKKIQELTSFKFVQIDELRTRFLNKSVSSEYYSLYNFIKSIEENEDVILEFTGAGCHKFAIKRALELAEDKTIIILCKNRDFFLIYERLKQKKLNEDFPFETDIETHVSFIKEELDINSSESFWDIKNSSFLTLFMDNFDDLSKNVKIISNQIKTTLKEID